MTDKEGTLQMQPSGRWAVCRPGRSPVAIRAGEPFLVEVSGEMKQTRMELRHHKSGGGEYYSADGYHLASGLRAALP
jgi:hypothetical protein